MKQRIFDNVSVEMVLGSFKKSLNIYST